MHQFVKLYTVLLIIFLANPLLAQEEDESAGLLEEAARAMNQRNFSRAEEIYRILIQQNKDDATLQQLLCHALINQKEFRECDSMLRRMVERDTNNAGNYWYMGLSAERQRKDSIAALGFKYYILKEKNIRGRNVKAWLHVGSAYRRMMHDSGISRDQCLEMIHYYKQYLQLNPGDPYAADLQLFIENVSLRIPNSGERLIWDESP